MLIFCGAGHGLGTPGKRTPDGEVEWKFNNKVVTSFIREMKKYDVKVVRTDDPSGARDIPLSERTTSANVANADFYISFHHNALHGTWGDHGGVETYYHEGNAEGKKIAQIVQDAANKAYNLRDRGVKTKNLHITRETKMTAVLLEGGFMDSTTDISTIRDDAVLAKAGKNVAKALAKHFGLKKTGAKDPVKPKPSNPNKDKISTKGLETLARETINGKYGDGEARKKALGSRYVEVQKRVNQIVSGTKKKVKQKGIETLVNEVIAGKHGNGEARRKSLGSRYDEVQKRVNDRLKGRKQPARGSEFEELVRKTINGDFGNGAKRKKALGNNYAKVQREVNRRLKG